VQPKGTVGVIAVLDSRTYEEDLAIDVPEGSELLIVAADWPVRDVLGTPTRTVGEWVPQERRPHLDGDLSVTGTAPGTSDVPGRLALDGLLVEGEVSVAAGNLGGLGLSDCKLVTAVRRQVGCVRFCFVPRDLAVSVPKRYRCQPDLALRDVVDQAQRAAIVARLVPGFTSTTYGDPGYGQLVRTCPPEIGTGAED